MMAKQKMRDARSATGGEQRLVTGVAGAFGQRGASGQGGKREYAAGDSANGKPGQSRPGFVAGRRPQSVIDGQRQDAAAPARCPFMREQCQRHAVGAPRDRDRQTWARFERSEAVHFVRELIGQIRMDGCVHWFAMPGSRFSRHRQ
jgi:hypothetical protein